MRLLGGAMVTLGVLAFWAPMATGGWSLALLSFPLVALSVAEARATFASPRRGKVSGYLPSLFAMLAAIVVFHSPVLVLNGLLILLAASLATSGATKMMAAVREQHARMVLMVNGVIDAVMALLLWFVRDIFGTPQAVGIAIGIYVAAAGWRMLLSPDAPAPTVEVAQLTSAHPDPALELPPNDILTRLNSDPDRRLAGLRRNDVELILMLAAVFFAIHLGRMPTAESWLGMVSPFVATAGDILMTLTLAAILLLPVRVLWRRLSRPAERLAWSIRVAAADGTAPMNPVVAWLNDYWLDARFNFATRLREARLSLPVALLLILRLGLPLTAFFVAINPIWGFTWYFNTESWASGIYQKLTQLQVDRWRAAMVDAVALAYGGNAEELYRIHPPGAEGNSGFQLPCHRRSGRGRSLPIFACCALPGTGAPRRCKVPRRGIGRDLSCRGDERL